MSFLSSLKRQICKNGCTLRHTDVEDARSTGPINTPDPINEAVQQPQVDEPECPQAVDSLSANRVIDRLPNELLLWILRDAVESFNSRIVLSHVCRRFRSIIVGSCEFWVHYELSSDWSSDMIRTIADRTAPLPIQVKMTCPQDDALVLPESVATILSLSPRIGDMSLYHFDDQWHGTILRWRLQQCQFPVLYQLHSVYSASVISSFPQEGLDMPMLQSLDVDFVPDKFQAENLLEFSLGFERGLLLKDALGFLSYAISLQELHIYMGEILDKNNASALPIIDMLTLDTLRLYVEREEMYDDLPVFVRAVRASCLFTLSIDLMSYDPIVNVYANRDLGRDIVSAYPYTRHLEISGPPRIGLQGIPLAVEELTFKELRNEWVSFVHISPPFLSRNLRLVRFRNSDNLSLSSVLYLRNSLKPIVRSLVHFEFEGCRGFRDGIFDLNDVQAAFIS